MRDNLYTLLENIFYYIIENNHPIFYPLTIAFLFIYSIEHKSKYLLISVILIILSIIIDRFEHLCYDEDEDHIHVVKGPYNRGLDPIFNVITENFKCEECHEEFEVNVKTKQILMILSQKGEIKYSALTAKSPIYLINEEEK